MRLQRTAGAIGVVCGAAALLTGCGMLPAAEPSRSWQANGETYQGRAIVIDDGQVIIVQPGGQTRRLDRKKLGDADREYVEGKGSFIAPLPKPPDEIPPDALKRLKDIHEPVFIPEMDGAMWQIADGHPDVSPYNAQRHNACDFSIWRAADGTWQMVACIRGTSHPGATRLFHRWEGKKLTDKLWEPKGVFATSDKKLDQYPGVMQAPHCFKLGGKYYFFYNAAYHADRRQGNAAYCKVSEDGKNFRDIKGANGKYRFFDMGRDLMMFHDKGTWYSYYCGAHMDVRTAKDLLGPWNEDAADIGVRSNPESPFVVRYGDDYYLWSQKLVYHSKDPKNFSGFVITDMRDTGGRGYAPEILLHEGQYYFSSYGGGIWLGRMNWVKKSPEEIIRWRIANYEKYRPRTGEEQAIERARRALRKKAAQKPPATKNAPQASQTGGK